MDSWYIALIDLAPDISAWPLFGQAAVTVAAMLGSVILIGLALWGITKLFEVLIKVKAVSPIIGLIGYLVISFFAWIVWVFLPWSVLGSLNLEADGTQIVQSIWLFFSLFLLVNLLAKDALDDLEHWAGQKLGTAGRVYQVSLLVLPLGVPLAIQLMRLKAFKRRKARYLEALQAIRDEHS